MKAPLVLFALIVSLSSLSAQAATTLQLNPINTNNCAKAQHEVLLLNSPAVAVTAICDEYKPQGYRADNGKLYDYRLHSYITVQGDVVAGQEIQLNFINTNNPTYALNEIALLSSSAIHVRVVASEYTPRGFKADNGRFYDYRVYTTVTISRL